MAEETMQVALTGHAIKLTYTGSTLQELPLTTALTL
jgi:hypothetical protein